MLLKYEYGEDILPNDESQETRLVRMGHRCNAETNETASSDPRKELNELKRTMGGFKVAIEIFCSKLGKFTIFSCRNLATSSAQGRGGRADERK